MNTTLCHQDIQPAEYFKYTNDILNIIQTLESYRRMFCNNYPHYFIKNINDHIIELTNIISCEYATIKWKLPNLKFVISLNMNVKNFNIVISFNKNVNIDINICKFPEDKINRNFIQKELNKDISNLIKYVDNHSSIINSLCERFNFKYVNNI